MYDTSNGKVNSSALKGIDEDFLKLTTGWREEQEYTDAEETEVAINYCLKSIDPYLALYYDQETGSIVQSNALNRKVDWVNIKKVIRKWYESLSFQEEKNTYQSIIIDLDELYSEVALGEEYCSFEDFDVRLTPPDMEMKKVNLIIEPVGDIQPKIHIDEEWQ